MSKKEFSSKDSMYLKSLEDYHYALPGFLPLVYDCTIDDPEQEFTLSLKPEKLTKPKEKVEHNTLPPATYTKDQRTSFVNRFSHYAKDGIPFPTNIVLRPIYVPLTVEVWNGYNDLQILLHLTKDYPDAEILVEYIVNFPLNNIGYNAIRAKQLFTVYRWRGIF